MALGETTIVLKPGMRVGMQVERVARDWESYEMRWDLSRKLIRTSRLYRIQCSSSSVPIAFPFSAYQLSAPGCLFACTPDADSSMRKRLCAETPSVSHNE